MGYVWRSKKNPTAASAVRWSPEVSKKYAVPSDRKKRGSYVAEKEKYNADTAGAFNILKKIFPYEKRNRCP